MQKNQIVKILKLDILQGHPILDSDITMSSESPVERFRRMQNELLLRKQKTARLAAVHDGEVLDGSF